MSKKSKPPDVADYLAAGGDFEAALARAVPLRLVEEDEGPPIEDGYLDGLAAAPPAAIDDMLDAPPPTREEPYRMTDVGNAERLFDRFGGMVRWCSEMPMDGYLVYDGHRWATDSMRRVEQLSKAVARDLVEEAKRAQQEADRVALAAAVMSKDDDGKPAADLAAKRASAAALKARRWAESSEMGQRLREMARMASCEVAVRHDALDADRWALNTWGGVVNLQTGDLRPSKPDDLCTKITGAAASLACGPPRVWTTFLRRIMGGDEEMVGFIQRALGYSITGSTREQCLFLLYGAGSNGKSTFLDTVASVLGDYVTHTRSETFEVNDKGGIPNDVADLRGARIVTASEIRQGAYLDEGLIKGMTGDKRIKARFLHQNFFEFEPVMKVWWALNHRPVIRGTDHGIWRRIMLIPFEQRIEDHEKDKDLVSKLAAERDAILAWMIQGCAMWQAEGLRPPARVMEATETYRQDMDIVGEFLAERCDLADGFSVSNTDLFAAWQAWSAMVGEKARSQMWFTRALTDRGIKQDPSRKTGRKWRGVALKPTSQTAPFQKHRWGEA